VDPERRPPLLAIALLFARVGNLTFGGGDAITAMLQRELVHVRGWLDLDRYGLAQGLASITPGTRILALCAAVAWMLRGAAGALAAVLAASIPSTVVVVLLTWAYTSMERSAVALGVLAAVLASAIGMMWAAGWLIIEPQMRGAAWLRTAVVAVGAFVALAWWSISPVQIIVAAAVIGFAWPRGTQA
jgi:chromate transporter